ncbi:hypothetical protein D6833_00060, partial [Candidatus Parcubacteria bacterium]
MTATTKASENGDRAASSIDGKGLVIAPVEQNRGKEGAIASTNEAFSAAPLPPKVLLEDVPIGKQTRPLNCELQSASDLAWYYGFPYTWDEIFAYVGHDPNGNPHKGFVGRSLDDPPGRLYPYGYGVYAEPIARALKQIGLPAKVHYNESREWLKEQVAAGNPVMIWATGTMEVRPVETWTTKDGVIVRGVRGEHTFLVIGYDENGVWLGDPWDGQRDYYSW